MEKSLVSQQENHNKFKSGDIKEYLLCFSIACIPIDKETSMLVISNASTMNAKRDRNADI